MTDGFARYESYKASGVEWIGEIPEHWRIFPLAAKAKLKSITNQVDEQLLSVYLNKGVILFDDVDEKRTNVTSLDLSKYQLVENGDFVLNNQQAWRGSVGVSSYRGIVSPAYLVLSLSADINPQFANYYFRDANMVSHYLICSKGVGTIQRNLYWHQLKRVPIFLPSISEQIAIANFLDQKTAEIEAAIAKKQRLIELLQEQKSILINQAVTRGLNPNVPMRESGVEWIGEIPEHWETAPLKHVSTVQSGVTLGKNYVQSPNTGSFPYLRVANVQDGFLDLSTITEITLPLREAGNYLLKYGDILLTEGGDIDKLGRGTCWYDEIKECLHQNHIFAIRIMRSVKPEYVSLITGVAYARRYFITTANKTTNLASTNKTKLGNLPLLIPPITEQELILKYCAEIRTRFDDIISKTVCGIEALKEMKATLIAELVTGKIKV